MIKVAGSFSTLQTLMNILFYQLKKEKEGKAQFKIDIQEIMNKVNLLISENRVSYEKENISFDSWLERNSKFAYENYGLKLGKEAFG